MCDGRSRIGSPHMLGVHQEAHTCTAKQEQEVSMWGLASFGFACCGTERPLRSNPLLWRRCLQEEHYGVFCALACADLSGALHSCGGTFTQVSQIDIR